MLNGLNRNFLCVNLGDDQGEGEGYRKRNQWGKKIIRSVRKEEANGNN